MHGNGKVVYKLQNISLLRLQKYTKMLGRGNHLHSYNNNNNDNNNNNNNHVIVNSLK